MIRYARSWTAIAVAMLWLTQGRGQAATYSEDARLTTAEKDVALAADGLLVVFSSGRPTGDTGMDLWLAQKPQPASTWGSPISLTSINTSSAETAPWINATATLLLFNSDRPEGQGADDLWLTMRASPADIFNAPVPIPGVINTAADEGDPWLSSDLRTLYFSRDNDIFIARR